VNFAQAQKYVKVTMSNSTKTSFWEGNDGSSLNNAQKNVYIRQQEPNALYGIVFNSVGGIVIDALNNEFLVTADFATKA